MGRAMLIIVAGVLFSVGLMGINTANQGMALTERTVNYAEFTMGKNAAHTAIQMAMQEINQDPNFPTTYGSSDNPWIVEVQGLEVRLHADIIPSGDYWNPDMLWLYSRAPMGADHGNVTVEVKSHYLVQPFSSLVPTFESPLTIAADPDKFTFSRSGNAKLNGNAPSGTTCEDKPGIVTRPDAEGNFSGYTGDSNITGSSKIGTNADLSYQPTDEMIARLANTDGVRKLKGNLSGGSVDMGSPENPGVFFVEEDLKITGGKIQGYGILVIRTAGEMTYLDEDTGAELELAGNFEFNGLVVFENAFNFKARGTPTINGSVLVGHTDDYPAGRTFDISMSGNVTFQYDCEAETYAKMAAADAVKQNQYTLVVSTENFRYPGTASSVEKQDEESSKLIEIIKGLL